MGHWSWNPFHAGAGCSFARSELDSVLPFITWRSQHELEGKAELVSTSSRNHKFESYKRCHRADLPGPPSLSYLRGLPRHTCLLREHLPPCLQASPWLLRSIWVKPKAWCCKSCCTRWCGAWSCCPLCPGIGSPRSRVVLLPGLHHKPLLPGTLSPISGVLRSSPIILKPHCKRMNLNKKFHY